MTLNVFIRADGSREIGLGHLTRCLSLAQMLRARFHITFICREIPDSMAGELEAAGFSLIRIKNDREFPTLLNHTSIVVLDGYHFDLSFQKELKKIGCKLVIIDDIHDREFLADLIINHAPGVTPDEYSAGSETRFLLGPDYALLRPGFLEKARKQGAGKQNPENETAGNPAADKPAANNPTSGKPTANNPTAGKPAAGETVFICFGGADVKNLTSLALHLTSAMSRFERIIVVTGAAWSHELKVDPKEAHRVEHHRAVDEEVMLRLMSESRVAVVPASGVLMEVLAAGCLAVSGYYTWNQYEIYQGFKELGAIIDAKSFGEYDLRSALERIAGSRGLQQARVIDGKSDERLLSEFVALAAG